MTHRHPGRVYYVALNVGVALVLMELNMFSFLNTILGFYSNVGIAWIGAVCADLLINKPLGWSPQGVEFKRAHLYTINPVGFGSMTIASVISVMAFFLVFGRGAGVFEAADELACATCGLDYERPDMADRGQSHSEPLGSELRSEPASLAAA